MAAVSLQIENQFSSPMVPRRLHDTMPASLEGQLETDAYRALKERVDKELLRIAEAAWSLSPLGYLLCGLQTLNIFVLATLVFLDLFFLDEVSLYIVEGVLAILGTSIVVLGILRLHSRLSKAVHEAETGLREALAEESSKLPDLALQLSIQPRTWHPPMFAISAIGKSPALSPSSMEDAALQAGNKALSNELSLDIC